MVNGKPQPYNNYNTNVHDCYTDVSLLAEIILFYFLPQRIALHLKPPYQIWQ